MKIEINHRGNGACPICKFTGKCKVQETIFKQLSVLLKKDDLMELVIYSCPKFQEKTGSE